MSAEQYEIGGIFKAIKQFSTTVEKEDDETNLTDLFSFQPTHVDEVEIPEEQLAEYLNPDEPEPVKMKKKKKKKGSKLEVVEQKDKPKWDEESPERKERTVFVGNVALTVKKKDLKKIFCKFGEIESLRIRSVPRADPKTSKKVAYIKKEFHSERSNMNAYVVFKNKECAQKSLQCNGMLLEDLHLRVDLSENKKHDTNSSVFVGNLPFNTTEEKLRNHFSKCGQIEDVRVIRDKATGIGKGFAYVKFQSKDNIMFGLKLNSSVFEGRKLRVFKAKDTNETVDKGKHHNKNFQGLRSTSQKDIKTGKKLFSTNKKSSVKYTNATRRMKDKQNNKQNKNKNIKVSKKRENKTMKKK